jgi:hypothetical protein
VEGKNYEALDFAFICNHLFVLSVFSENPEA